MIKQIQQNQKEPRVKNEDLEQIRSNILRPLPRLTPGLIITTIVTIAILAWSTAGTEASPQKFVNGIPTLVDFCVCV